MNLTSLEKCNAAEKLIQKGRFEDAGFLLDQVLESHPQNRSALVAKGALQMKAGRIPEAKRLLQAAYDLDPADPVVLTNMASLALFENRLADALEHLQTAAETHPEHLPALLLLGQIHQQLGDLPSAQKWLVQAVKLSPADPSVLVALSSLALLRQNLAEAKALLDKALEVEPDHVRALTALAHLKGLGGDFQAAAELAARAHLEAPQDPDAAVALARIYLASGSLREAGKLMDRFKARFGDFPPVVLCAAEVSITRGEVAAALSDCAKWLRKAPKDSGRIIGFLKILKKAGAWQQLLDLCSRLPVEQAELETVRSLREEAFHALGRSEEGWASWAERRGLGPEALEGPLRIALPVRTPLLDELVLMRFVNTWAASGPVTLSGQSSLDRIWGRLAHAAELHRVDDGRKDGLLPADLAALTTLHAPAKTGFAPYLAADPGRSAVWREALPTGKAPLVGIFWQSAAPGLLIDHLHEALSGLDVVPVSLQFDEARHQLRAWPEALDAGVALEDLGDLVNLVACLDMVIGPDGIPLHIAGAMGKKAFALLQQNHDWYWAGEGGDSTHYPSVRRIVKPAGPDWTRTMQVLRTELTALVPEKV
ncbi:tetratricopeptide repeat protein [Roseibium sp. M-1]